MVQKVEAPKSQSTFVLFLGNFSCSVLNFVAVETFLTNSEVWGLECIEASRR